MLISSQWYTKSEQAPRFSLWYCGLGLGQMLGGIVSYAFQQIHHPAFTGWRIMFVVLGVVTVLIGMATIIVLPDTPMKANFLSDAEKAALLNHVSINKTGVSNPHFKVFHIVEILLDIQIWLMTILTILVGGINQPELAQADKFEDFNLNWRDHHILCHADPKLWLYTSSGGTPEHASRIVSIASTLGIGWAIRRTSNRWVWIVACCIPGILGGGLMSFAPQRNHAAILAGIYLVNSVVATLIIIYQWTRANVAGHTKRAISVALISGSFSVGNIIGPQTFQAKDAPGFIPAKITVLATQAAGAFVAVLLCVYYLWANKRKGAQRPNTPALSTSDSARESEWENLTDKQNPTFEYVY